MEQVEEGQGGRGGRAAGLGWAGGEHGAGWWAWWLAGGHGGWWLAARWHGGMAQDVVIGFDKESEDLRGDFPDENFITHKIDMLIYTYVHIHIYI